MSLWSYGVRDGATNRPPPRGWVERSALIECRYRGEKGKTPYLVVDFRPQLFPSLVKDGTRAGTSTLSPSLHKEGARGGYTASLPKHKTQIENIQARLWDLLPLIRNNIYHPNFQGSFSIKSVLPALIPEMSYEGMLIADGEQAGLALEELVRGNIPKAEKKRLRDGLVAYCRQDTLAMVELLARIRQT